MGSIFDIKFMVSTVPEILAYLPVTLLMAVVSCSIGFALALGIALIRYFRVRGLDAAAKLFISFIRGTPMIVQLYLSYYGLPVLLQGINASLGTNWNVNAVPRLVFAFFAFSLNSAAYMSETIRSAMLAVDVGQLEACYSVDMTTGQALRSVILPQAFATALPPLGNSFISLVKETSLAFSISVVDMMAEAKIVGSRSFRFFEIYIVVSVIYWVICIAIERVVAAVEVRLRRYDRERSA
jgi:His/Glu/Gln/Arg/opine family amino acid ABC transporter permease subunit